MYEISIFTVKKKLIRVKISRFRFANLIIILTADTRKTLI